METVAVVGASGFVGSRLVQGLALREGQTRALTRHGKPPRVPDSSRLAIVQGDVTDQSVLARLLRPGCAVVNLAYDAGMPAHANLVAAESLARACLEFKVSRLVH